MAERPLARTPRRRRRAWVATVMTVAMIAVVPIMGTTPAGATTAPLITEDGIGIRLDRTAIDGPALAEIETALQPFVDDMIYEGAADGPFPSAIWIAVSSNLELSFDVLPPGGSRPSGGLALHADIRDIEIEYRHSPWWPFADCSVYVEPDDATVDITATVDKDRLPATPIELDGISATWDDSPNVRDTGVCWYYVFVQAISDWWNDIWDPTDPESTASKIENMLEDTAQDLIDDLWADHVAPVLDSLEGFGVTINKLHTDDHGLIVTADVNADPEGDGSGIEIPGLGGPFDVSGAADSGADSDVDDLLANRTNDAGDSHVIVSVHPNVVNQVLYALHDETNGAMGNTPVSDDIAMVVIGGASGYASGGWSVQLRADEVYHTEPTGPDGLPQLQVPQATVRVFNSGYFFGALPVATFDGSLGAIDLVTEVRESGTEWGPGVSGTNATASLAFVPGGSNPDAIAHTPNPANLLPYVREGVDNFNEDLFVEYISLAPLEIGSLSVDLCPLVTCGRYVDDERYTETFLVS